MFAALNSFLTRALTNLTDVYWPFVSMLLHGDSAQQFNQDTSTNVFPISDSAVPIYSVASMQASTRTPFTGGPSSNGSGFFNGTNAGLTTPANTAFVTGTTSTVEMWVYPTTNSGTQRLTNNGTSGGLDVFIFGALGGVIAVNGANAYTSSALTLNVWSHLAVVYNSGTLTIYFNGVSQALTGTTTGYNFTANDTVYIGNSAGNAQFFAGYLSNVRVVKGVAVYTGAFTPPTASLAATQSSGTNISAITGAQTSLLTLQTNVPQNNNQFFDTSTNNFTVTRNGNTTQGSFNPFVSTYPYSVATNGGSGYFDGTGDYLTVPDSTAFNLAANDFTIECWVNFTTLANSPVFSAQMNSAASVLSFSFTMNTTGRLTTAVQDSSSAYKTINSTVGAILIDTWYHVALVRDGNTNRQYINGVQTGSVSVTGFTVRDSTDVLGIGCGGAYNASQLMTGYISNFRLVNGTCLYPSGTTFTPPTAPLTAVTNTALLLGMSNGAIYDNTMLNNLETVADAQISTSVFKYGTGSMKFDGTGDYLPTPAKTAFNLGTGDFTLEMWVYSAFSGVQGIAGQIDSAFTTALGSVSLFSSGTTVSAFVYSGSSYSVTATVVASSWNHLAFVRDGTSTRLYVNGVQGTASSGISTAAINTSTYPFTVGRQGDSTRYFNGYIDDFRFTKGICRYPSGTTFTPPTAAFPNLGPTYPSGTATQRAIFGFGADGGGSPYSMTNIVSNTGVVAGDTTGVGTARGALAAAGYGGDKAIFGFGSVSGAGTAKTNLVSNTGVVASGYGSTGQAIFGFGYALDAFPTAITSLVSNTGVVAADTAGVGTARNSLAAAKYGTDKAIFGFGIIAGVSTALTNLVSNTGVVSTDTAGVGTARYAPSAAGYGTDKAIFGYGYTGAAYVSTTNLVSNTGVVATDTTGVGTAGYFRSAAGYGGDKAIFGYGYNGAAITSTTNLVSNTGVVATDTTGVGTARQQIAAAGFSYS